MAKALVDYLLERKLTISCAESCTGGQIAAAITAVSGCSAVFPGGVCTYSEEMKIKMLGVKRETLDTYGVVSPQTALEMARGVRSLTGSDIAVATTGIAGPSGGTAEQPVGTVCIAIVRDEDEYAWCENFAAGEEAARTEIQRRAVRRVLEEVMNQLEKA
ncbi:MAG: CinA family protein [Peptococcaceae bacterium]|nr:CinA family protein [Peptococcaceae bacterium]